MDLDNWLPSILVGIGGIIFGLIFGYIFYRRTRRVRIPIWSVRTNNILQGYTSKLSNLDIKYKGMSVENLSITKILFWNKGAETIDRGDIAEADPVRIEAVGDIFILDVRVIQVNSKSSQFFISVYDDQKSAVLNFDYLDRGKGVVLQIVHTGTSSKDIAVLGSIKGVDKIVKKKYLVLRNLPIPTSSEFDNRITPKTKRIIIGVFSLLSGILVGAFFLIMPILKYYSAEEPVQTSEWVVFMTMGTIYLVMGVYIGYYLIFRSKPPTGLNEFEEEQ